MMQCSVLQTKVGRVKEGGGGWKRRKQERMKKTEHHNRGKAREGDCGY